jgi:septum site-determining protein MinC
MAAAPKSNLPAIFELKSAALTLISVVLKTTALDELARELRERLAATPGLFEHDPVVIDLTPVRESPAAIDFGALVALLREHKMVPVAVRAGSPGQMAAALEAGLAEAPEGVQPTLRTQDTRPPAADAAPEPAPTAVSALNTLILDRPLRSGQQVYARGADLVVMAAVSFGAEVIADGNIHVYAPLRGRAIAGARGNASARIFTTCLEAQLISIAGTYRTTETPLPPEVLGKPAQVRLDGDSLLIEPLTT